MRATQTHLYEELMWRQPQLASEHPQEVKGRESGDPRGILESDPPGEVREYVIRGVMNAVPIDSAPQLSTGARRC